MVLVDGSVQNRYKISENWEPPNGFGTWSTGVVCYLTGRIASLVEPVVNTPFATIDLWA